MDSLSETGDGVVFTKMEKGRQCRCIALANSDFGCHGLLLFHVGRNMKEHQLKLVMKQGLLWIDG